MRKLKYALRNINLINIILIAALILIGNYTVLPIFNLSFKYKLPAVKKIKVDQNEKPVESQIPSPTDYALIAEENLFHPDRKIPVEKKDEKLLPKPDFVLYGTIITDDLSLAYLEDLKAPRSTPGRGKRQTTLKIGNTLSGFTLKEIETDKVAMVRGDERIIIPLNDPSHPKDRKESGITAVTPQQPMQAPGVPTKKTTSASMHGPKQKQKPEKQHRPEKTQKPEKQYREKAPLEPSIPGVTSNNSTKNIGTGSPALPDIKTLPGPGQQYKPSGTGGALLFPKR